MFVAHHSRIFDHIYLIDHMSVADYRILSNKEVTVFRLDRREYALDIGINALIQHCQLPEKYDWISVLDVDEFLPFLTRSAWLKALHALPAARCYTQFWLNSIPIQMSSTRLNPQTELLSPSQSAHTSKQIYRGGSSRSLFVRHGNHAASFPVPLIPRISHRSKSLRAPWRILHIPFLGVADLAAKLTNFPKQNFADKIEARAHWLTQKYGSLTSVENMDTNDMLWLVANYRTNHLVSRTRDQPLPILNAERHVPFSHLQGTWEAWADAIDNAPLATQQPLQTNIDFAPRLRRRFSNKVRLIRESTRISSTNEIEVSL